MAENRVCFDCSQRKPIWASSTFGVFICLDCAGGQRRLGTHISFVRSCDMDERAPAFFWSFRERGAAAGRRPLARARGRPAATMLWRRAGGRRSSSRR